jgi:hypothetical protein
MAVPLVEGWVARGFRERMAPQHWVRFVHQVWHTFSLLLRPSISILTEFLCAM